MDQRPHLLREPAIGIPPADLLHFLSFPIPTPFLTYSTPTQAKTPWYTKGQASSQKFNSKLQDPTRSVVIPVARNPGHKDQKIKEKT